MIAEVRATMRDELASIRLSLRRLERGAHTQQQCQEVANDGLQRILQRLIKIERAVDLVEAPSAPRHSRRHPLGRSE